MGRLFGTDGVRGIANAELTPELAFKLGKSGAHVLSKDKARPVVLIGKDTRLSGDMLEDALSAGILAVGGNVIKVGVLPTPAIAYLVRAYKADAGVVISASHNPFEYNGIKFFNRDGFKLDDEIEDEIEDIILRDIDVNSHITGDKLGRCLEADDDALDRYADFLKSTLDVDIKGRKLVLDCANGAAYRIAEKVYSELGADITVIGNEPNGVNINDACGSTHPEKLQEEVIRQGAFLGMAYDGDADRLIACDETGTLMDGDKIMGLSVADDYITKPFNPLELVARVKSHMRRYTQLGNAAESNQRVYRVGGLVINDDLKEVTVDGQNVRLTPIEYNILLLLVKNQGKVFSINQIYESIWNEEAIGADNTVAVHIRHIREKIEINPKDPQYLKVVWGVGYKIEKIEPR